MTLVLHTRTIASIVVTSQVVPMSYALQSPNPDILQFSLRLLRIIENFESRLASVTSSPPRFCNRFCRLQSPDPWVTAVTRHVAITRFVQDQILQSWTSVGSRIGWIGCYLHILLRPRYLLGLVGCMGSPRCLFGGPITTHRRPHIRFPLGKPDQKESIEGTTH